MGLSLQGLRLREECGVWPATLAINNENALSGESALLALTIPAVWLSGAPERSTQSRNIAASFAFMAAADSWTICADDSQWCRNMAASKSRERIMRYLWTHASSISAVEWLCRFWKFARKRWVE